MSHEENAGNPVAKHAEAAVIMKLDEVETKAYIKLMMDKDREERVQERQRARDHELKLETLKAEKEGYRPPLVGKIPRLPPYQEGDDIEAFFLRLDRFSLDYKWSEEAKLHQLLSLLSGKAMNIYNQLETAECATYDELKAALLKAFGLTTEECRAKFRDMRIKPHETGTQFAARLSASFRKYWISDGAPQTLEGIVDLMKREVYVKSLPLDLVANLNQRKVKTLEKMKVEVDAWFDAHGHPLKSRTGNKPRQPQPPTQVKTQAAKPTATQPDRKIPDAQPQPRRPAQQGSNYWRKNSTRWRCSRCSTNAHHYYECPKTTAAAAMVREGPEIPADDGPSLAETSRPRWKGGRRRESDQDFSSGQ